MDKAVDGGQRHGRVREDPVPIAERLVGGDEGGSPFVSGADEFEEHAGFGLILGDVGEIVEDQQVVFVEPGNGGLQPGITARDLQLLDKIGGAGEEHAPAVLDQPDADGGREMGFAAARRAEADDVGATFQPGIARDKGHDLGFGERGGSENRPGDGFPDVRDGVELEGVERLCGWQPGLGQVTLDPASAAPGDLELGQSSQQPCCGPALLVRALGEAGPGLG